LTFPSLVASAGFANTQRPAFSISAEDGISVAATVRDRLRSGANGTGGPSVSTVGTASLYKSLDLPGFAHHVIALRGAVGYSDDRAAGYFLVGGVSGNPFQIIPGYTLGEGRQPFPVRGFSPGTLAGTRAIAGSAEYRIPLFLTGGAPGPLPFFFDRSSLTLFGDYGSAWCPNLAAGREVCNNNTTLLTRRVSIASAGAELNLNLGVLSWDTPYRFRLGVVAPQHNAAFFGRQSVQVYLVSGISF
jgi:Outer membrane protein/protective antigen OMA87